MEIQFDSRIPLGQGGYDSSVFPGTLQGSKVPVNGDYLDTFTVCEVNMSNDLVIHWMFEGFRQDYSDIPKGSSRQTPIRTTTLPTIEKPKPKL
jgi:hypothetical protein